MTRNRDFGRRAKQAREALGVGRRAVARYANITVERLEMIEAGRIDNTDLGQEELVRLADVLNKPLSFLINGEADERPVAAGTLAQRSGQGSVQLPLEAYALDSDHYAASCPLCRNAVRGGRCDSCGRPTE